MLREIVFNRASLIYYLVYSTHMENLLCTELDWAHIKGKEKPNPQEPSPCCWDWKPNTRAQPELRCMDRVPTTESGVHAPSTPSCCLFFLSQGQ